MKKMYLIPICFIFLFSCFIKEDEKLLVTINHIIVNKSKTVLKQNIGEVYYQEKPFTGITESYYRNKNKAESIMYFNGKKHGVFNKWFPSGMLSFESFYTEGKQQGTTKTWWKNGNIRSESNFSNGIVDGLQKQWYKSGEKFKEINIVNGKEEGMQRSWRKNGAIYNNYEAKNGRIFGLKRSNLCYSLKDEEIQYKK